MTTDKQKAKAYDEALERAKSFQKKYGGDYAGYIFPELRESEDKWFIKELQGFLESYGADYFGTGAWQKFHDWLEKQKEQKPSEWSEEDKVYYDTIVRKLEVIGDDYGLSDNQIKFLREHCPSHRSEWSEEDEKIIQSLILEVNKYVFFAGIETDKIVSFLKSLRPSWNPSEEQMMMLLAVINEPNNAGAESYHIALMSLYNDLKKLI